MIAIIKNLLKAYFENNGFQKLYVSSDNRL